MKFYHGTSKENADKILKEGFSNEKDTIWNCSDPEMMYVVKETEDEDELCWNYFTDAKELALNASQIAAAFFNSQSSSTVVFEFDVSFDVSEDFDCYFEPDCSCENMADSDCYQVTAQNLNRLIKAGFVKVTVHTFSKCYNPSLRVFYLPRNNEYLESIADEMVEKALSAIKDVYIDDIFGCFEGHLIENIPSHLFGEAKITCA